MVHACALQVRLHRFAADRRATSAVEFAILAPVFMLFVLGMTAYGIYFGASHSIQQIAADAARTAIAGVNETERRALVEAFIDRNAEGYPFVARDKITLVIGDSAVDANQFVVSIRYDAADLPIWGLFEGLPMPGMTIARSSTIRTGGI